MLDQPSLKNLQPPDMPKRRIARRLVSMVIVFCGMLMALESILGGQMTSRQFRVDEANQELPFALSVGNEVRTLNPSDGAPPTEFARSGIKEEISDKYKKRYEKWKSEYLSTEAGRNQWEMYEEEVLVNNKNLKSKPAWCQNRLRVERLGRVNSGDNHIGQSNR